MWSVAEGTQKAPGTGGLSEVQRPPLWRPPGFAWVLWPSVSSSTWRDSPCPAYESVLPSLQDRHTRFSAKLQSRRRPRAHDVLPRDPRPASVAKVKGAGCRAPARALCREKGRLGAGHGLQSLVLSCWRCDPAFFSPPSFNHFNVNCTSAKTGIRSRADMRIRWEHTSL